MLGKKSKTSHLPILLFCAFFNFEPAAAAAEEAGAETAALDHFLAMLAQQEESYSIRVQSLSESLTDPEAVNSITEELLVQLRDLRSAISSDSPVFVELEAQLDSLVQIETRLESDQSRLNESQVRAITMLLENQAEAVRERMAEILHLQEQIDRDIVELESIQLFLTYQVQLSNYSGAAESANTIAEVLASSIDQLSELSSSFSALQPAVTSE